MCPRAGLDLLENQKNLVYLQRNEPRVLGRPTHSLVDIPIEISQLPIKGKYDKIKMD